jgi:FkbM family methyltransferase
MNISEETESRRCASELLASQEELARLRGLPPLTKTTTEVWGRPLEITDPFWYLHCYRELFGDEIYRFNADRADPLVIDCGANIGMSVIYFKYLYPKARIIAFEPDPNIFAVLERNVRTFELQDVELHRKAVWNARTKLRFAADGSIGGKLVEASNDPTLPLVGCERLRDYLDQKVDFLKLDIEGAEYEVIRDCERSLKNVNLLFVEYHSDVHQEQLLHELLRVLHRAGFRYHAKEAWSVAHPFVTEQRPTPYDLQLNIFAYRNGAADKVTPWYQVSGLRRRLFRLHRH